MENRKGCPVGKPWNKMKNLKNMERNWETDEVESDRNAKIDLQQLKEDFGSKENDEVDVTYVLALKIAKSYVRDFKLTETRWRVAE